MTMLRIIRKLTLQCLSYSPKNLPHLPMHSPSNQNPPSAPSHFHSNFLGQLFMPYSNSREKNRRHSQLAFTHSFTVTCDIHTFTSLILLYSIRSFDSFSVYSTSSSSLSHLHLHSSHSYYFHFWDSINHLTPLTFIYLHLT